MTTFLDITLVLLTLGLSIPIGVFSLEVALSLLSRQRCWLPDSTDSPRLAVLIPAKNEEGVIGRTLKTLMPTVPDGGKVVVVADNCTDSTASIARAAGAAVVERTDLIRRGKGFALEFGLSHLANQPPQVVVFLDADCQVRPDTVRLLAAAALASGRPVQGLNLCDPDPAGGPLEAVWGLAFRFKNLVRILGLARLAGVCHLTGSGMALPWALVERAQLASGNAVEDMQLGIDLALAGYRPLFLPEARVDSPLAKQRHAARTQRTRWEHGHLNTLLTQVPRLVGLAATHRRLDLFWLALDLAVPPLSLLVMVLALGWLAALTGWLMGAGAMPLLGLSALGLTLLAAVWAGWLAHCRQQIPAGTLLAAFRYAAWKLPNYVALLIKRQSQWVRTHRDAPSA